MGCRAWRRLSPHLSECDSRGGVHARSVYDWRSRWVHFVSLWLTQSDSQHKLGFGTLKLSCICQSACFFFVRAFAAHQQKKRRLLWESCIMESEEKERDGSVPFETSPQDPLEWRWEAVATKWLKSSFILVYLGRKAPLDAIVSCILVWKALSN